MNETVKIWLEELGNPTRERIEEEIEEVKGAISNEKIWALANGIHYENIEILEEYLEELKKKLNETPVSFKTNKTMKEKNGSSNKAF